MAVKKSAAVVAVAKETKADSTIKKIETTKGTIVTIPGVKTEYLTTLLIGTAPLIAHSFSQKARLKIRAKHEGEASAGREPKDCIANFEAARYRLSDGSDGIPAAGLKACLVAGFAQTKAVGAVRVEADDIATNLVRLIYPQEPKEIAALPHIINETGRIPRCREDIVRNESGVVDLRHRPEYWPWAVLVRIQYLPAIASARQVLQALAMSGFKNGQCEWRPTSKESKSGSYGTFRLATAEEVELFAEGRLFEHHEWPNVVHVREAAE